MPNSRAALINWLETDPAAIADESLAEHFVFQSDTVESPTSFPFIVIRWLDTGIQVGPYSERPFEMWSYDKAGDYTRAIRNGHRALQRCADLLPIKTDDGVLSQIRTNGRGLGRGLDLFDEGWDAVVVPFRAVAVASGI